MKNKQRILILAAAVLAVIAVTMLFFKRPHLEVPKVAEIEHINVVAGKSEKIVTSDMNGILTELSKATKTHAASVNDQPQVANYTTIRIVNKDETEDTVYYYQKDGSYFLEKPYGGIYRSSKKLTELINKPQMK